MPYFAKLNGGRIRRSIVSLLRRGHVSKIATNGISLRSENGAMNPAFCQRNKTHKWMNSRWIEPVTHPNPSKQFVERSATKHC